MEIEASATADEVRHLEEPRATRQTVGTGEIHRHDHVTRKNLPHSVEPGRNHLDVRVSLRTGGRLALPEYGRERLSRRSHDT